ncbi:14485_t:CDS:2, partial [Dentiscutata erythropus]
SNCKTLQKRKEKENETVHQREARLARDRENKRKKKHDESNVATSSTTANISVVNANITNVVVESNNVPATNFESTSATTINEDECKRLKKFRSKMNKLKHVHCPTCNEYFLSIVLVNGKCHRCHTEKTELKKLSQLQTDEDSSNEDSNDGIYNVRIPPLITLLSMYRPKIL